MKSFKYVIILALGILLLFVLFNTMNTISNSAPNKNTEKLAIEKLLFSYRDALNTSDADKVVPLYAIDGVFMPSEAPSAIGSENILKSLELFHKPFAFICSAHPITSSSNRCKLFRRMSTIGFPKPIIKILTFRNKQ